MSEEAIIALAGAAGLVLGAIATGLLKAWSDRTARGNKWLNYKRGQARGFMQHIAVHCREEGEPTSEDIRLIEHYYRLALAVSKEETATTLYQALPERLRRRVHEPSETVFSQLRAEVTPRRRSSASGESPSVDPA